MKFRDYMYALFPASLGSLIMVFGILIFTKILELAFPLSDVHIIISSVLMGTVFYLSALFFIKAEILKEMIEILRELITSKR